MHSFWRARRVILCLLFFVQSGAVIATELPLLNILAAESASLKASQPERWKEYLILQTQTIENHRKETSNWQKRSAPPRLDFKPLELPLPVLALQAEQEQDSQVSYALLDAISVSSDPRRLQTLLALRNKPGEPYEWARLLTTAADKAWALPEIERLTEQDTAPTLYHLFFNLLNRFAAELPPALRKSSYALIRRHWRVGPTNGDGEKYWDLLLKLNTEQAREEIIPYYASEAIYVVALLNQHATPSPLVAMAVKRWLLSLREAADADGNRYNTLQLKILLLKSDPEGALQSTLQSIDTWVADTKPKAQFFPFGSYDGEQLIKTIIAMDANSTEALTGLVRYVHEPAISRLTQIDIILWLAKRRYAGLPQIIARWRRENLDEQHWLEERLLKQSKQ